MKILECEPESDSLIVAFASENSKKPIEEWDHLAYQPTYFDNPEDTEEVLRQIARSGIANVQDQEKREEFIENCVLEEKYSQYVGKELVYDIDDLLSDDLVEEQQIIEQEVDEFDELEQILADIASADEEIDLEEDD